MGFPVMYQPWTTSQYFRQYSSSPKANTQITAKISLLCGCGYNLYGIYAPRVLRPLVTTFLFLSLFSPSPIYLYFTKNVNRWGYNFTFFIFYLSLRPLSTMLGIHTLFSFGFGANTFPHSTTISAH